MKRPGLLWLSRRDVKRVRDRIITLYLAQGEYYEAAVPDKFFGFDRVLFTGGIAPCFLMKVASVEHAFWLKVPGGNHNPYWDYKCGDYEIERLAFNDPRAALVACLVGHWSRYFPFVQTDNYLQKGGDFVA